MEDPMSTDRKITLFHNPHSRSVGAHILLEELGADFTLQMLDFKAGQQLRPEYLAINPMGKVPAIRHGDVVVTEQVAIYLYLADLYPEAKLAPPIGDPQRGPYLRWMAFYGSCFEPAMVDRSQQRDAAPRAMSPYGDFDLTWKAVTDQLSKGDWFLGDRFTALDVLWGTALTWMTLFKLVPTLPLVQAYTDRANVRPAFARARAKNDELAATLS
jgi:glutathione S-transferase